MGVCYIRKSKYDELNDREFLYEQHIVHRIPTSKIATSIGCSQDAVRYAMQKFGIQIWQQRPNGDVNACDIVDLYIMHGYSIMAICQLTKCDYRTIAKRLRDAGVECHSRSSAQIQRYDRDEDVRLDDRDWLYQQHIVNSISCKDIGSILGHDAGTVRRHMRLLGIKPRNNAESKRGLMCGDKHPNWQNGRTKLSALCREYFTCNIAPIVLRRDGYCCQECGATKTELHVHHIIPFKSILDTIIENNPGDNNSLYQTIINDEAFLNTNNLITLCKQCHKHRHSNGRQLAAKPRKEEGSETIENLKSE